MVSASNFISADKNSLFQAVNAFLPKQAVIPLAEDDKDGLEILISEGERVKEGGILARANGIFVHSSIPGIVQKIEQRQYSNGKQGLCAIISLNGAFSFLGKEVPHKDWKNYDRSSIEFLLKENGVLNTFEKNIPIYSHIKKARTASQTVLTVRLFDSDPSFVTDSFIAQNFLAAVIEGAAILARTLNVKVVLFAYSQSEKENIKPQLDSILKTDAQTRALFDTSISLFCVGLDTKKYPSGTMHDIVGAAKKTIKTDVVSKLGKKDIFIDSATALNIYNAIALGKPIISNFIHVTGDCLNAAALLHVRMGTSLRDIVEQCGGFKRKLSKIVINGILCGTAVSSLDIPIARGVKSIEFVPTRSARMQNTQQCIRCGNCRKICPVQLWPGNLYRIAHVESFSKLSENDKNAFQTALLCSECALCNSVCPSRLPLSQTISLLKDSKYEK